MFQCHLRGPLRVTRSGGLKGATRPGHIVLNDLGDVHSWRWSCWNWGRPTDSRRGEHSPCIPSPPPKFSYLFVYLFLVKRKRSKRLGQEGGGVGVLTVRISGVVLVSEAAVVGWLSGCLVLDEVMGCGGGMGEMG